MSGAKAASPTWKPGLRAWRSGPPTSDQDLTFIPIAMISRPNLEASASACMKLMATSVLALQPLHSLGVAWAAGNAELIVPYYPALPCD